MANTAPLGRSGQAPLHGCLCWSHLLAVAWPGRECCGCRHVGLLQCPVSSSPSFGDRALRGHGQQRGPQRLLPSFLCHLQRTGDLEDGVPWLPSIWKCPLSSVTFTHCPTGQEHDHPDHQTVGPGPHPLCHGRWHIQGIVAALSGPDLPAATSENQAEPSLYSEPGVISRPVDLLPQAAMDQPIDGRMDTVAGPGPLPHSSTRRPAVQ